MKYFRLFLLIGIFVLGAFFVVRQVAAQTPEDEATKHGIKFPITDLGNCANVNSCMTYCEDPVNHDDCTAFAKKRGFYKEPSSSKKDILDAAAKELGCNSPESCRSICEDPVNQQKCINFAKRHGMEHRTAGPPSDVIAAAKRELGCDSTESCQKYCEHKANLVKCQQFAAKQGFGGVPPSGGDYKKFCAENPDKCRAGRLSGPGGCSSLESCQKYCTEHPAECGYQPPSGEKHYSPPSSYTPPPTSYSYTPPPDYSPQPNYSPPPTNYNYTPPPEGSYTPPPQDSSTTYPTSYPGVHGIATKSFWQRVADFFFGIFGRVDRQ